MDAEDMERAPKYVVRDNDLKFTAQRDDVIKTGGAEIKRTVPLAPNPQAHAERFIQSLNFAVLDKFVIVTERHLNYVNREWRLLGNRERPHEAHAALCRRADKPAAQSKNSAAGSRR